MMPPFVVKVYHIILAYFYKKVNQNLLPIKIFLRKIVALCGKI